MGSLNILEAVEDFKIEIHARAIVAARASLHKPDRRFAPSRAATPRARQQDSRNGGNARPSASQVGLLVRWA